MKNFPYSKLLHGKWVRKASAHNLLENVVKESAHNLSVQAVLAQNHNIFFWAEYVGQLTDTHEGAGGLSYGGRSKAEKKAEIFEW